MKTPSLKHLLGKKQKKPELSKNQMQAHLEQLQLNMLRVQQGIWHGKGRAIIAIEGFDAAGKGGCIRTITEALDPRGFKVHPIGPPEAKEQCKHWLYRFWKALPEPGTIAIFDRTWYGRVLVEKVEGLVGPERIRDAYSEINDFEETLRRDGIHLLKFFLGVSMDEQLARFEDRLKDPYKQWKISEADLHARERWQEYVAATDKMFKKTHTKHLPWHLIPADHKNHARAQVLGLVVEELEDWGKWIKERASELGSRSLLQELKKLGKKEIS